MNKNLYHHNDKTFKAGENMVYIADLPAHLMHTDVPKNVASYELFKLVQRDGNELLFKSGAGYATEYRAKALKSPSTGLEICFVNYCGSRLLLESTRYMHGGKSITQTDLDTLIAYNGQTLRDFLKERGNTSLKKYSTSNPYSPTLSGRNS